MITRSWHKLIGLTATMSLLGASVAFADPAPFDLAGPVLQIDVTRRATTLPITRVPNLLGSDRLRIKAILPPSQSTHYLMVAAFLRGPTNPPPDSWFRRCDTWIEACRKNGLDVTVPEDAQYLLIFFAPQTGGDFKTLRSAVQGRPGAFVRAAQDLNQTSLDRSRLEQYLAAVRTLDATDAAQLSRTAPLLARSLAIKVNEKCLDRIPALQAPCLMEGQESLILSDDHSASMAAALTSGPASDLAIQAASTKALNSGAYIPYIGSVLDIARLMDSFRTAQYQYIPALAMQRDDRLALMLNASPSFHDPMSVLVAALPAVGPTRYPTVRRVDVMEDYCARKNPLVLPVFGAPIVFATKYAHRMALSVIDREGKRVTLPAHTDATRGGFVVDTSRVGAAGVDEHARATLTGFWGFDEFQGPTFQLVNPQTQEWAVATGEETTLVAGRENTLHLHAARVACIKELQMQDAAGRKTQLSWKAVAGDQIAVDVPLKTSSPGNLTLLVRQHGVPEPQPIHVIAFADPGRVESFTLHAGDGTGLLKGNRLDLVERLTLGNAEFLPGTPSVTGGSDLEMTARDTSSLAGLKPGDSGQATIWLKDGRRLALDVTVAGPRPKASLIAKAVHIAGPARERAIRLGGADELPLDATLMFSVRAISPATFAPDETIEVATADGLFSTTLSFYNGGITRENAKVAVATLAPAPALGPSAFGALRFRLIENGVAGDWQPLAVLVRLPTLRDITCAAAGQPTCKLSGSNLFLLDSVAGDAKFAAPMRVPDGFPGDVLPVPHLVDGRLYFKLRDDPAVVSTVVFSQPQAASATAVTAPISGNHP